jgi:hypothetical protein
MKITLKRRQIPIKDATAGARAIDKSGRNANI